MAAIPTSDEFFDSTGADGHGDLIMPLQGFSSNNPTLLRSLADQARSAVSIPSTILSLKAGRMCETLQIVYLIL